ncbi:MAG: type II toxin-antitoxin system VapC family toxin [Deltaproteobacteria bacterium]|nr:type II toxin-antitoxin system VapC family toxin [Deltaproteobacteria bacterium]
MAVFYLDTSALVKRYRTEQGTEVVEELLANPSPDDRFFICFLSIIEMTSGVLRLARGGQLREDTANRILARLRLDVRELLRAWPLNEQVAADAVTVAERHTLRSGDAIHLAAAQLALSRQRRRRFSEKR